SPAAGAVIEAHLKDIVLGADPHSVSALHEAMRRTCRNIGTKGLVGQAISAVDIALWDLSARLQQLPLAQLMGAKPESAVSVYGSGGFTTLTDEELHAQVDGWLASGCRAVKIKVGESWGTNPARDLARTRQVREQIGPDVDLMIDANGGYGRGQARRLGAAYDELGVVWFEEPVSSDDLEGLAAIRQALRCDIAAGEYAWDVYDARALCPVVDCLQLDATRITGYTGWLRGAAVAAAHGLQVSAHCAPSLHAVVAAAAPNTRHIEWFADHARLEPLLVDGAPPVADGLIRLGNAFGHGMTLAAGAERYRRQ
ncbi:MAG TPA: enolase C-terminal domain-like protein, partial [Mycobacteriales bacterium]|nr:enolase C-terminal domain-like protein [Mycobacteriales bacterium]